MHARDAETHRRDGEDHLPASETHRRDGEDHLPASETHRRDGEDHLPASELYLLDAEDAPPRRGVLGPCRFLKKVDRLDPPPSHTPPRTTGRAPEDSNEKGSVDVEKNTEKQRCGSREAVHRGDWQALRERRIHGVRERNAHAG